MSIDVNMQASAARSAGDQEIYIRPQVGVVVESSHLFAGRKEVQIRHRGEVYRLLLTKNGKLILNK